MFMALSGLGHSRKNPRFSWVDEQRKRKLSDTADRSGSVHGVRDLALL